jgi:hypothetical protein
MCHRVRERERSKAAFAECEIFSDGMILLVQRTSALIDRFTDILCVMKRKPRRFRLPSKAEIRKEAERGVFDRNPLLATPHEILCEDCGCRHRVIFLQYLRSGQFEFGKTETIEVVHAAPTPTGLRRTVERITPIIIRIECDRCGSETSCNPLSLEYLLFTTSRKESCGLYV